MTFSKEELDELRELYFKRYKVRLNDQEVLKLAIRLVELLKVLAK